MASYDTQVLIENLAEQMRDWRFNKRYDDSRMLLAVDATFGVLDGLEGVSLAERWARFEEQVWPRWQAGIDRPDRGTRWGFGVWALVIARLVRPQWATIATVRIGDWTRLLPADDPVIEARRRLADAAGSCSIGSQKSYEIAINMATRLMLTRGADRLDDLSENDLLIPPSGMKGGDVLDVLLCQLEVFDRTPRSGTARRRTAPRHSERELAVVAGVPEPFVEVVGLYLETYARRLSEFLHDVAGQGRRAEPLLPLRTRRPSRGYFVFAGHTGSCAGVRAAGEGGGPRDAAQSSSQG